MNPNRILEKRDRNSIPFMNLKEKKNDSGVNLDSQAIYEYFKDQNNTI